VVRTTTTFSGQSSISGDRNMSFIQAVRTAGSTLWANVLAGIGSTPSRCAATMQHLRQLDPALRISNLKDWLPLYRSQDLATLADGLQRAGLPE